MFRRVDSVSRLLTLRRATGPGSADRVERVTMEIGRADARILVSAHADGRVRLEFGTGEEFVGSCKDFPARIEQAARRLLDEAAPYLESLPVGPAGGSAAVRISVHGAQGVRWGESGIAELRDSRSPLAPLWRAFSDLSGPLIGVLFKTSASEIPALTRARNLWGSSPPR